MENFLIRIGFTLQGQQGCIPEERQSKQLKFLAFAYEGRYDIIRSALFEDDEARYEEARVLTNVEDFPAFCRPFSQLNYNCQN